MIAILLLSIYKQVSIYLTNLIYIIIRLTILSSHNSESLFKEYKIFICLKSEVRYNEGITYYVINVPYISPELSSSQNSSPSMKPLSDQKCS